MSDVTCDFICNTHTSSTSKDFFILLVVRIKKIVEEITSLRYFRQIFGYRFLVCYIPVIYMDLTCQFVCNITHSYVKGLKHT